MNVIELEGAPRQRGQVYGETMKGQIQHLLGMFKEQLGQATGRSPISVVDEWLAATNYLPAIEQWTPQLLDEVAGIGEGAGVVYNEILAWQLLDELGCYLDYLNSKGGVSAAIGQCSTVGVYGEMQAGAILAQNWDSLNILGETLTLLHIKETNSGFESLIVTSIGRIGPFGMTNYPTGICLNGLNEYLNSARRGLPVVFAGRGALEQGSNMAAGVFIQKVQHSTAQAYTIAGPQTIWVYEASANQVRHVPFGSTRIVHTNHPMANDDLRVSARTPEEQKNNWRKTTTRYECIQNRLADRSKPVGMEEIKLILGSHDSQEIPVCRHPGREPQVSTAAGMIMEFSEHPALYLVQGPPCASAFRKFSFDEDHPRNQA